MALSWDVCQNLVQEVLDMAIQSPSPAVTPIRDICLKLVQEVLEKAIQTSANIPPTAKSSLRLQPSTSSAPSLKVLPAPVKPKFQAKRPPPSPMVRSTPAKQARIDEEEARHKRQMQALSRRLEFVSKERDQWRQSTEEARSSGEQLALENNRLSVESGELREMAEEQGRICTLLAAELVEVIWSLTGGSDREEVGILHVTSLCRIGSQAIQQCSEAVSPAELRLATGLLGCLVNLAGSREGLMVMLGTEEGCGVVVQACSLACANTTDMKLVELGMMLLTNILGSKVKYGVLKTPVTPKMLEGVRAAAGRLSLGDRAGKRLQEVAKVVLALAGKEEDRGGKEE